MKIGNQIVNGFFIYNDQLEFTQDDLVLYNGLDGSGQTRVGIYYVISASVKGVSPIDDVNNLYYQDYFYRSINIQNNGLVLTESSFMDLLQDVFVGLDKDGVFNPRVINAGTYPNNSGIWKQAGSNKYLIVFKGTNAAYMIEHSTSSNGGIGLQLCIGTISGNNIIWEGLESGGTGIVFRNVISDANKLVEEYITRLKSLEIMMRSKINELETTINALRANGSFTPNYNQEFNIDPNNIP